MKKFKNNIMKRRMENMNNKLIYGVGICNKGKYNASINRKHTKCYTVWFAMLQRCYSDKYHEKHPTYIDCQVYKDWLYFQSFAKWYHENYYEIIGQKMALDKDILCKGNKIYSPETCIFVPQSINLLFTKTDAKRGEYLLELVIINKIKIPSKLQYWK